jgi:two-component SAPR family response regulator
VRSNSFLDWSADVVVDSYDSRFERMVIEARAVGGEERFTRLRKALDLVTGPYLPTSELEWAADRSFRLEVLQEDAELELAELAIGLADFPAAASFAERILAKNPSNPAAYKLLLEVEISSGTRSGALAVYQRAREALDGTGLSLGPDVTARLSRHLA